MDQVSWPMVKVVAPQVVMQARHKRIHVLLLASVQGGFWNRLLYV